MKEYFIEGMKNVDLNNLITPFLSNKDHAFFHKSRIIVCHDVFVYYKNGFLLVKRERAPVRGEMWPIGGAIRRGVPIIESLILKTKAECGLDIYDIKDLGTGRTFFATDPFGHGKGTDTINFAFFARGKGELKLDDLHSEPMVVDKDKYRSIKKDLHPYVRNFIEKAFAML